MGAELLVQEERWWDADAIQMLETVMPQCDAPEHLYAEPTLTPPEPPSPPTPGIALFGLLFPYLLWLQRKAKKLVRPSG